MSISKLGDHAKFQLQYTPKELKKSRKPLSRPAQATFDALTKGSDKAGVFTLSEARYSILPSVLEQYPERRPYHELHGWPYAYAFVFMLDRFRVVKRVDDDTPHYVPECSEEVSR